MKSYLDHTVALERMLETITQNISVSKKTLDAMRNVPRHHFVSEALWHKAYEDITLPTSDGQTISQPTVVAQMTDLLDVESGMSVLEIGTGSGYQAAILSQFSSRIFSIERIGALAETARERFRGLGYNTIICREGDGTRGWPDRAPFDRIIVTAGAPVVPESLLNQLAPNGKLLIPTGSKEEQILELYTLHDKKITREKFDTLLFVPLVGEEGWQKD